MKKTLTSLLAGAAIAALGMIVIACDNEPKSSQNQEEPKGRGDAEEPKEPGDNKEPEVHEGTEVPFEKYALAESSFIWTSVEDIVVDTTIVDDRRVGWHALLVIDSDEELRNHVEGDHPPVDFSKQTLLFAVGRTGMGNGADFDDLRELSQNKLQLWVNIFLKDTLSAEYWLVAVLVNKLDKDRVIGLNVINDWAVE